MCGGGTRKVNTDRDLQDSLESARGEDVPQRRATRQAQRDDAIRRGALPRTTELGATPQAAIVPPLFEAYLHAGALVCGEPAWDPRFNVADLLILLPTANLETRYASHPLNRRAA